MRIEMVLDVPCVWSYFAFARFQRAAARFRERGGELETVFLPFQLRPDATVEGEPKVAVLRRAFGDATEDAIAGITAKAADEGLTFRHAGAVMSSTFEAHRLIAVASEQGRGAAMVERLFRAHHTDELNVADPAVLRRLAAEAGVEWSDAKAGETRAALERVRASGIRGVPVFYVDGRRLGGAQSEEDLLAAFEAARSTVG
ncbi:DsbA family oxidoreductase [Actinomadura kijaniata]|uniref:Putative DsbA family dithiol-disulfide isomerase n=1 Tax=Actinomadura namibiensis TaxID=182080 RepID=A0A7W3LU47_ACTNM|nr:DsbA family protein [Actinomadura namibiensis]MBA8954335.1 putative DsbA family dithiol-disulfide isomerase [Actinomadura namibiensis]